jgi:hypothetical protein
VERYAITVLDEGKNRWLAFDEDSERPGGRAEVQLPTVPFFVVVTARGHAIEQTQLLQPDLVTGPIELQLEPVPGVHGRVVHRGEPVAGARVELRGVYGEDSYAVHNGFRLLIETYSVTKEVTAEDGSFMLTLRDSGPFVALVQKEGYALAEGGPWELDARVGATGLEIELGQGGAIEGRVLVDQGTSPAGTIVGINRGDGHARTVRVGPDGSYRFEGLTPGSWQVVRSDHEIDPSTSSSSFTSGEDVAPVVWDCTVFEGETTVHDLDLRAREACALAGTLLMDGAPAAGWTAQLVLHMAVPGLEHPTAAVAPDGSFRLEVEEPGRYDLLLERHFELGRLQLKESVEVERGERTWSLDLPTATLKGDNAPTVDDSELGLRYVWSHPERSLRGEAYFHGDSTGRFSLSILPAGPGELLRLRSNSGSAQQWDPVAELELAAGEIERVVIP